jgi:hypothetical protein
MESITNWQTYDLLLSICERPRMYFGPMATTRDLIVFIKGVRCGVAPPHGNCLAGFDAFVCDKFKRQWTELSPVLLEEFGDKPFFEGCEALAALLKAWMAAANPDQH